MDDFSMEQHFNDGHIFRLTDDTGMFQHAKYAVPDPRFGYTTDDNARALIMALMLYERYGEKKYLDLIYRYASFLLHAQNEAGRFRNFMGYDRKWIEQEGSEDCFGRCLWALAFALANEYTPDGVRKCLAYMLNRAMPHIRYIRWPRAKAYALIGMVCLEGDENKRLVKELADSLYKRYDAHNNGEWKWFEDVVTYCNSVMPWSLAAAYRGTGDEHYLRVAEESMAFLETIVFRNGYFKPVGCHGWYRRGEKPAEYDEQPVEACEAVFAYTELYQATGRMDYLEKARKAYAWYTGENSKRLSLVDSETGGCFDGLTPQGVNLNRGAESLISYVMAYLKLSGSMACYSACSWK